MAISVNIPLSREAAKKLRSGDSCLLSGVIYTARDAAHKRLCDLIAQGNELPLDIKQLVENKELTIGHARALLNAQNPSELANEIIEKMVWL